jgi:NADH-quinone oxidoreductase subunit N
MIEQLFILKAELLVTGLVFFLLLLKIGKGLSNQTLLPLLQLLLLLNFIAGFVGNHTGTLFGSMFYTDPLILFEKNILNGGVYLLSLVTADWLRRSPHLPEFFLLLLSSLLGFFFLLSSGHLLLFYLSLELATIPIAALANFELEQKRSAEGAMKMILSAAFSSALLLFGISWIYGTTGTLELAAIPATLNGSPLQLFAFIFLFAAFAFKLSVVPFHLWTADVYEGSPLPVTAYLSVISKGATAFIFMTILFRVFQPLVASWYPVLVYLALATLIVGNLFALRQQNLKRFLAFSSIAQVGFILVGMSGNNVGAFTSVVYFVLIYIFSNLAAFGVITVISTATQKEQIDDLNGLYKSNPFLSWVLALALFSLAGIPPTAGFFGKLFLLTAGGTNAAYWFILAAALNMIISLYYYLRVVRAVFMGTPTTPAVSIPVQPAVKLGLLLCTLGILLAGLWGGLYDYIAKLINL